MPHYTSWNRYSYTRGDPVNRIDSSGLEDTGPTFIIDVIGQMPTPPAAPSYYIPPTMGASLGSATSGLIDPTAPNQMNLYLPPGLAIGRTLKVLVDSLRAALDRAEDALRNNSECRALFAGTTDPAAFLEGMMSPTNPNQIYFSFFKDYRDGTTNQGYAQAAYGGGMYTSTGFVWTQSDIQLNVLQWNTNTTDFNAATLIHELGHVFNIINGLGGSQFKYDANNDPTSPDYGKPDKDAEEFNANLEKKCIK